jgi:hypothetical protein
MEKSIPILFNLGEVIGDVHKPSPRPLPGSCRIHHHLEAHTSEARVRLNQFSRDISPC